MVVPVLILESSVFLREQLLSSEFDCLRVLVEVLMPACRCRAECVVFMVGDSWSTSSKESSSKRGALVEFELFASNLTGGGAGALKSFLSLLENVLFALFND